MKTLKNYSLLFALLLLGFGNVFAQETLDGYNDQSLRPVHKYDQLYKRTVWYRIDGREKQNRNLFAVGGNELSEIIIGAVKAGIIRPFANDSLKERLTYEDFIKRLTIPGSGGGDEGDGLTDGGGGDDWGGGGGGDDWGGGGDDSGNTGGGDTGGGDTGTAEQTGDGTSDPNSGQTAVSNEFFAKDLNLLEIKEHLIFDKKRSRMIHDIQSITIKIPSNLHPAGLETELASFSYKELVNNVFKDNASARWYNNENEAEDRSLAEAFDLRLFGAHMIKYANWDDKFIADMYGEGKSSIVASQQIEYQLCDYEQDVWEN
ncbi:MAG: gliding motility protein GldN [Bacteroidetes bacterium]|nr:MAG: gliding motility protein GldN [Bacteroidota bacterium]